ncbi:MAG: sodium:proton antiporter [Eggerthellaceae bacterium]|nr:sodium:proton antiporter [Eggerthellaceae bacterium]
MDEMFALISTGAWSIVPPLLALALALITKEVYSSLLIGVFTGLVIYTFHDSGASVQSFLDAFTALPNVMVTQLADNAALVVFLALLGSLVVLVALAGGSRAYGEWVTSHIKSAKVAQIMTAILGILIFVDDYFNCLTVGAVMRPITDRFRISHEKLAWIIDSTAAPVCIIAPVSSWAVAMGGFLGEGGFSLFVQSIPYNFYALATIVFVFAMIALNLDFGPMRAAENKAQLADAPVVSGQIMTDARTKENDTHISPSAESTATKIARKNNDVPGTIVAEETEVEAAASKAEAAFKGLDVSSRGTVADLLIPILVLIGFSIIGMLYVGGFFSGASFADAIGEDPIAGLIIGVFVALGVAALMYLPRKLMTLTGYMEGVTEGARSMVGAIMILVLAWSLSGICRYMIGTGVFVGDVLAHAKFAAALLPAAVFVVSGFIGFAMGTSWGTVGLISAILLGMFAPGDPLFLVSIGAMLGGAVLGDHISPISDTTILSSTGADCNHLSHVSTQMPYALLVGGASLVGYVIAGFMASPWVALVLALVLPIVAAFVLHKFTGKGNAVAA